MDKKLLIFDLDGTLSDTQPILYTIVLETLRESGIEIDTLADVYSSFEEHGKEIIELKALIPAEFLPAVNREKYSVDFWDNYAKLCMKATECVFDGMRETLDELKARGYLLAVLSNKKNKFVQPIIATAFGEGYFDFVCGWDEVRPKKPDPTSLLSILEALNIERENAWMIGDLPADYSVSVNAGINHIVADWGYGKKKKFIALGATVFAKKPIDLLDILK
ncbi:MAG: HAD family hydrolase [Clostridia bacterium]|nr:HAD family hydrolase [Clostridia bacterium]